MFDTNSVNNVDGVSLGGPITIDKAAVKAKVKAALKSKSAPKQKPASGTSSQARLAWCVKQHQEHGYGPSALKRLSKQYFGTGLGFYVIRDAIDAAKKPKSKKAPAGPAVPAAASKLKKYAQLKELLEELNFVSLTKDLTTGVWTGETRIMSVTTTKL